MQYYRWIIDETPAISIIVIKTELINYSDFREVADERQVEEEFLVDRDARDASSNVDKEMSKQEKTSMEKKIIDITCLSS